MKKAISVLTPAEDSRSTAKGTSEIHLSYGTYPLYVGNRGSSYDGYGAPIDIEAEVSGEYAAEDITWSVSDDTVLSMTKNDADNSTVNIRAVRTGYAAVTATLPDGTNASCYIPVIDNYNRLTTRRIELNADTLTLADGGAEPIGERGKAKHTRGRDEDDNGCGIAGEHIGQ